MAAVSGNHSLSPVMYPEPDDKSLDEKLALHVIFKATMQQADYDFRYDVEITNFRDACVWILEKDILINYKIYHDLIRSIEKISLLEIFFNCTPLELKNKYFYTAIIELGFKGKKFIPYSFKAYEWALHFKKVDAELFTIFIRVVGQDKKFGAANKAFFDAKKLKMVDEIFYANFIKIAKENKEFSIAKEAFNEASKLGYTNAYTYAIYFKTLQEQSEFGEIKEILIELENAGSINEDIFSDRKVASIYLSILMENNNHIKAFHIFKKWILESLLKRETNGIFDFHKISQAEAQCYLKHILEREHLSNQITLITGKGNHSPDKKFKLRTFLQDLIQKDYPQWQCEEDPKNSGQLLLAKKSQTS